MPTPEKPAKKAPATHKPNPPGRPGNIAGGKTTAGAQKSATRSTGGPTSKGGGR